MTNIKDERQEPLYRHGFDDVLNLVLLVIKDRYKENKSRPTNSCCKDAVSSILIQIGTAIKEMKDNLIAYDETSGVSALLEQIEIKDQLFNEYATAVHKMYENRPKIELTEEEIEKRNTMAETIIRKLVEK